MRVKTRKGIENIRKNHNIRDNEAKNVCKRTISLELSSVEFLAKD